jgi:hypothetical protein
MLEGEFMELFCKKMKQIHIAVERWIPPKDGFLLIDKY